MKVYLHYKQTSKLTFWLISKNCKPHQNIHLPHSRNLAILIYHTNFKQMSAGLKYKIKMQCKFTVFLTFHHLRMEFNFLYDVGFSSMIEILVLLT
jgi:hypothetical protein